MRSFFQREQEPAPKPSSPSPARTAPAAPKTARGSAQDTTRIARGSTVVGEISGTAELVIEGRVRGEVELKNRVVVGREGIVEGRIVGASVEVGGKVVGNVRGVERVQVLESGKLEGDVLSPRVVIAEGAFFKGKVEMTSAAATGRSAKPAAAAGANKSRQPPQRTPNKTAQTPQAARKAGS